MIRGKIVKSKIVKSVEDIEKIKRYCAYQERCLYDVRCKLKEWKVDEEKIESIMEELILEGYINEERFARMFVRGKFHIKSWGIQKIIAEMKKRNINDDCIKREIREISQKDYLETLDKLVRKWLKENPKGSQKVEAYLRLSLSFRLESRILSSQLQ